jgi:hypothetical protein
MAKTKISEFSSTAADNTDITNINIAEGCSPANVNNAIRSLMSVLKNFEDGSSGDSVVVGGNLSVNGTTTLVGTAIAPTPSPGDNSTKIATTAFVQTKVGTLGTMSTQNATAVAITGGTITGITDLAVADGGTGASTLSANAVLLGNGTSALQTVAPSTSGNILTSNGTTWTSAAAPTGITATSGSAPYYGARAWVNFDGNSGSIRNSQNVSNVTKNATGEYTITFATAMPDANYAVATNAGTGSTGTGGQSAVVSIGTQTSSSIRIMVTASTTGGGYDKNIVCVTIFR